MPEDPKAKAVPDLSSKLSAPVKKSLFERQKAEAEAKRAREKAETAAVYEDFVKSFENDNDLPASSAAAGRPGALRHGNMTSGPSGGAPARRHFTGTAMRSSAIGSLGLPPPSFSRKRTHDGLSTSSRDRESSRGILGFDNSPVDTASAFRTSDDEEEKSTEKKEAERAAAKPTLHLSSLPPGTSPAVVKSLVPPLLIVDQVKIIPPSSQGSGERKIWSAIVILAKETAATDMDTVVSSLQNKYLGWGFYLSISRHLSSVAINSSMPVTTGLTSFTSNPFGARPTPQGPGAFGRGPPGPHRSGIAPPTSYGPGYGARAGPALQVDVRPPSDLKQLKLIHKTLENLLTYGPEFEALLMSRPEVQKEEKWAWIWNSRSVGGVWYRWKLWDILTNSKKSNGRGRARAPSAHIFENSPAWVAPEKNLEFEFITRLDQFVSDEEYDSSDEDDSDREDEKRISEAPLEANDRAGHLNPLHKAKLVHLLARLPTSNTKLRRGDVARVTAFAISHAGEGSEEAVNLIVSNVKHPFAYTTANPDRQETEVEASNVKEAAECNSGSGEFDTNTSGPTAKASSKETLDVSPAMLVGLFIISDILSSSSTSGVRHAWKFRQLFEIALKGHKVFERLGRLEKELGWGRLKTEKWRRSIANLLSLWESWCVFPQSSHDYFVQMFEKPPLTEKELEEEKTRMDAEKNTVSGGKGKSRWKTVDDTSANADSNAFDPSLDRGKMNVDIDGTQIPDTEELIDGESMSDIDGVPMEDSDLDDMDGQPLEDKTEEMPLDAPGVSAREEHATPDPPTKRHRPQAEDMFADSDSE